MKKPKILGLDIFPETVRAFAFFLFSICIVEFMSSVGRSVLILRVSSSAHIRLVAAAAPPPPKTLATATTHFPHLHHNHPHRNHQLLPPPPSLPLPQPFP
jgi:hypothetical protein